MPFKTLYRPDVDGLRAIAVLAVVGYHAFPELVPGGFIGVDVFFVISGYLIGSIIFNSTMQESFSIYGFFSHRIKRIFPALAVVLSACLGFGWLVLLPDELAQLGKHVTSGGSFIANFVLNGESGYFDNVAETKPLLHLWSLGIEAQFYLVAPLLWVIAVRFRNGLSMLFVALVSFSANVLLIADHATSAFFLPFTRVWELLAGAMLAYVVAFNPTLITGSKNREFAAFVGVACLIFGMCFITVKSVFPGWWALLPVCGALAVIGAGKQAWFNRRVLSSHLLVGIGLISYPLYLWHYPLLSFATILVGKPPILEWRAALVVGSFILAWLTYVIVERPIRVKLKSSQVVRYLMLLLVFICSVGWVFYQRDGIPDRHHDWMSEKFQGDIGHDVFFDTIVEKYFPCEPSDVRESSLVWKGTIRRCFQSSSAPHKDIALIGDSHAEHLFPGFAEALPHHNVVSYIHKWKALGEDERMQTVIDSLRNDKQLKTVLISWNWMMRLTKVGGQAELKKEMEWLIGNLLQAQKNIFLLYGVPNFSFVPSTCKYDRLFGNVDSCGEARARFDEQRAAYITVMEMLKNKYPEIVLMDISKDFCDAKHCYMTHGNTLLYRDTNHLGISGSRFVADQLLFQYPSLANRLSDEP